MLYKNVTDLVERRAAITSLKDAVAELVHDGDTVALEGFTHLIPVAAGHEIIRQRRRDLTLVRMTPDIVYDQLIGAGCARKLIFSWGGNPGVGSLHRFRDAVEHGWPGRSRSRSTATPGWRTPTSPARPTSRSRCCAATPAPTCPSTPPTIKPITCPFTGETLTAVPALRPDVAIIHAQRADRDGNVQLWGLTGVQKEAVLAAERSLVTVEEIVDELEPRPNAVVLPRGSSPAWPRCRAARSRPTRRTTTTATTTPTARGTRSAATARRFGEWLEAL